MNTIALALALLLSAQAAEESPSTMVVKLLAELRATPCADELVCWKRKALRFDVGLEGAGLALDSLQLRLSFADAEVAIWRGKATNAQQAIDAIKPALALVPTVEPWHKSPVLWFAVGFVAAVGLALGIFVVAKRIEVVGVAR